MNIAIVDDRTVDLDNLQKTLEQYAAIRQRELTLTAFSSAEELLAHFRPGMYETIFLDIYMGGMSGVEAAEKIRAVDPDVFLVFLTSSGEHMPEAFQLHAFDYLQKPAQPDRVFRVLNDIWMRMPAPEASLAFTQDRIDIKLPYKNIVAVETAGHYLQITDRDGTAYRPRMTFAAVSELLTRDKRFLPIIRGVLVNLDYVTGFGDGICRVQGKTEMRFPVNVREAKKIQQIWRDYVFDKIRGNDLHRGENS